MSIKTVGPKRCSTHMPLLIKCVLHTDGPILELGTGLYSTPLLHWLASEKQRPLISHDDNEMYYQWARQFQNGYHRIRLVTDWNKLNIKGHWSVALIDQSSRSRSDTVIALKDKVDFIVIHDSDSNHPYKYDRIWPHFKYRFNYTKQQPNTTVVSNFDNLEWLNDALL